MSTTPTVPSAAPAAPPAAPVMNATTAPSMSFDQKFDAMLAQAGAPPATPETPPVEPLPADPALEVPAEPPEDLSDLEANMPKEGEDPASQRPPNPLDLNTSRGQRVYGHHKVYRQVEQHVGYEPSAEDIQTWYDRQSQIDDMEADFTSPDPTNMVHFVAQWHQRAPDGLQRLANVLPDYLAQVAQSSNDPSLYNTVATPVLQRFQDQLYREAEEQGRLGNTELAKSLFHAGNVAEWKLTNKFRPNPYNGGAAPGVQPAQPEPDPLASDREALARERQQIDAWKRQQMSQAQQGFVSSTMDTIITNVSSKVDEALKSIKDSQPPELYEMYRDRALKHVRETVPKSGGRFNDFKRGLEVSSRAPSMDAQANLVNIYVSMASKAIQSIRPQLLALAAKDLSARTAQAHVQMAHASAQVAPGTGAAPVPASTQALQAPTGLTGSAARQAMLGQLLGIKD